MNSVNATKININHLIGEGYLTKESTLPACVQDSHKFTAESLICWSSTGMLSTLRGIWLPIEPTLDSVVTYYYDAPITKKKDSINQLDRHQVFYRDLKNNIFRVSGFDSVHPLNHKPLYESLLETLEEITGDRAFFTYLSNSVGQLPILRVYQRGCLFCLIDVRDTGGKSVEVNFFFPKGKCTRLTYQGCSSFDFEPNFWMANDLPDDKRGDYPLQYGWTEFVERWKTLLWEVKSYPSRVNLCGNTLIIYNDNPIQIEINLSELGEDTVQMFSLSKNFEQFEKYFNHRFDYGVSLSENLIIEAIIDFEHHFKIFINNLGETK